MLDMDESAKPPPITEMFQKFALAFKTKTYELFADDDPPETAADGFTLLDPPEQPQKVVVIKPDPTHGPSPPNPAQPPNTLITESLISSLFATISSFEASYLQLQTAHVPFDEATIKAADESLVSYLQRLCDLRQLYGNFCRNPNSNLYFPIGSALEAEVQENQSKLRTLETMFNRLQADIDVQDGEVLGLRKKLDEIQQCNTMLSKRLAKNVKSNSATEVLLTIGVFESMLRDCCKSLRCFTKLLIGLMGKAGWDLDLAANSVHAGVEYAKKGDNRHAFLSYVCLGMFRGFDSDAFGLDENGLSKGKNGSFGQLIEHVYCSPLELLRTNPRCDFSRFCEMKYEELIHPTMELSIFRNFDRKEVVLDSWRSLSVFYEAFVRMASSIWLLHKLAYSFNPVIEIFQVERGVDFSLVYMEAVARRGILPGKSRPKVGFTVVPGFRIGMTVIQSQVYLTGLKCTE
ncbi:hypothetical protein RJ639_004402 [Escallonia herrerae]|uniref:DUF641 domain-containing protein n=1 Tax=Escallonia herrerae TaxID=1293975 RepID=A0AA89B2G3_9ASTE|nr:hypothetical protein RJ639_004402 [Escallonia herrerae]